MDKHSFKKIVGERIRDLRIALKMSQDDLAELVDSDQRNISKWERGVTSPDLETISRIAKVLKSSTDFILNRDLDREAA